VFEGHLARIFADNVAGREEVAAYITKASGDECGIHSQVPNSSVHQRLVRSKRIYGWVVFVLVFLGHYENVFRHLSAPYDPMS